MQNIEIHTSKQAAENVTGGCACGETDTETPELDVQTIPHAIRHAAIFGALESLRPGFALIISATHNPLPLLKQLEEKHPGGFNSRYLDEGPERWRILFRKN